VTQRGSIGSPPLTLTPPVYLVRHGTVWAIASFDALRPAEGHVSGEHLVLAYSGALTAAYRRDGVRACRLGVEEWFADRQRVLVRIHSECLLSETFGFDVCDCREQLRSSMERIVIEGEGLVVYLRQEGRGIGLSAKLRTFACDPAIDTFERNRLAGYADDLREYGAAADVLLHLGITVVNLITDSPWKAEALVRAGVILDQRVSLQYQLTPEAARELLAKKRRGYHIEFTEDALKRVVREGRWDGWR